MYSEQCVPSSAVSPGHQFISHEPRVIYRLKIGGCGLYTASQCALDNAVMSGARAIQGSRHGPRHCLVMRADP